MRYDIIGDVHGCYDELVELIHKMGYRLVTTDGDLPVLVSAEAPPGRKLAFVGDLVDRGPASDLVLNLVMQLHEQGLADVVSGNHDNKYMRYLKGNPVRVGRGMRLTIDQVGRHGDEFVKRVRAFLEALPVVHSTDAVILVHAAYRENLSESKLSSLALYGETDGTKDEHGYPKRLDLWESEYQGDKTIVRGHDVVSEPSVRQVKDGVAVVNVDTGCVFGGRLSALRFPEMELVSVPARAVHWTYHNSASSET